MGRLRVEATRRTRPAGALFLCRRDHGRLLPADLLEPPPAARQRALLPHRGRGRGRRLSRLQALPSFDGVERHCVGQLFGRDSCATLRRISTGRVRLEELGRVAHLSPFTVQRLFKREMGVSPLAYQRALRASRMRRALKQGGTVTDAIYDAGFSSSSRAYEANQLGMTPQRFAQGGKGEQIGTRRRARRLDG